MTSTTSVRNGSREGPPEAAGTRERYHIRAILRALDVMEAFSPKQPTMTLRQISESIGLNSSTTFRLLTTLSSRGYVEQEAVTGHYRVGVNILRPASSFIAHLQLRERVYPLLVQLRDECRETAHLTILDRTTMEVVYLERLDALQPIGLMNSRVGGRSPSYCTGVGKALLAWEDAAAVRSFFMQRGLVAYTGHTLNTVDALMEDLDRVRRRGYAIDNCEHEDDVMCMAVPVWNHLNAVVAAISVSGPAERVGRAIGDADFVKRVLEIGAQASREMGSASVQPGA